MKKSYSFFIWIVLLILGLMAVLVITQVNTSESIDRLVSGNDYLAQRAWVKKPVWATIRWSGRTA